MTTSLFFGTLALVGSAHAQIAAFAKGMYCENGTDLSKPNFNNNAPVGPLYNLTQDQWRFQHTVAATPCRRLQVSFWSCLLAVPSPCNMPTIRPSRTYRTVGAK